MNSNTGARNRDGESKPGEAEGHPPRVGRLGDGLENTLSNRAGVEVNAGGVGHSLTSSEEFDTVVDSIIGGLEETTARARAFDEKRESLAGGDEAARGTPKTKAEQPGSEADAKSSGEKEGAKLMGEEGTLQVRPAATDAPTMRRIEELRGAARDALDFVEHLEEDMKSWEKRREKYPERARYEEWLKPEIEAKRKEANDMAQEVKRLEGGDGESSPPRSPAPFFRLRYTLNVDGEQRQFTRAELEQGLHTRGRPELLKELGQVIGTRGRKRVAAAEEEEDDSRREKTPKRHCLRAEKEPEAASDAREGGEVDTCGIVSSVANSIMGGLKGVVARARAFRGDGEDGGSSSPEQPSSQDGTALNDGDWGEKKQLNSEAEEEQSAMVGRKSAVHCAGDGSKMLFEAGTNLDVYGRDGKPRLGVVLYGEAGKHTVHFANGDVEHGLDLPSEQVELRPSSNVLEERFGGELDRIVELDKSGQHLEARIARMILAVQVNGGRTPVGHPLQQINRLLYTERHERRRKAAACKRALAPSPPKSPKAKKRSSATKSRRTPPLGNRSNFSNADGDDSDDNSASVSSPAPKRQRSDDGRMSPEKMMWYARQRVREKRERRSNRSKSPQSPQRSPTVRRRLFDEGADNTASETTGASQMDVDDEATETTDASQMDVDDGVDEVAATTEESSASDVSTSDNGTSGAMCLECDTCSCGRASPHGCTSSGAAPPPRRVRTRSTEVDEEPGDDDGSDDAEESDCEEIPAGPRHGAAFRAMDTEYQRSVLGFTPEKQTAPAKEQDDGDGDDQSCEGEEAVERTALHPAAAPINPADPLHEEPKFEALIEFMRNAVLKRKLSDPSFRAAVKQGLSGLPPRVAGVVEMLLLETKHHASSGDESSDGSSENDVGSGAEASSESNESDGDESGASADGPGGGIDDQRFHRNDLQRVPRRFILHCVNANPRQYTYFPGNCRLEQVCLEFIDELSGWDGCWNKKVERLGKRIFDALKVDGFVFVTTNANNRYVPLQEPGEDFDAWVEPRGDAQKDKASYRSIVAAKIRTLRKGDAQRKVKEAEAARLASKFEDAKKSSPSLGIFEHDSDDYTPHPLDPSLPADVSEEDESFKRFQKEKAEKLESSSTTPTPRSCSCGEDDCDYESCGLDSTWKAVFQHSDFFEHVLELEEGYVERNETPDLGELLAFIQSCKFECFASMNDEQILESLLNRNTKDPIGRRFATFQERWSAGDWRLMFGDIVYGVQRRLCGKCYCCGREVRHYPKSEQLYGFHADHLLEFWWKKGGCSQLRKSIALMLLESLKTRLVCGFCHETGDIMGYADHLRYVPKLTYDFSNGVEHRTAAQALELREMKCFILELKSRGAFWTGKEAKMSWTTLEFLVWKYFRVILSDVTYFTEGDWIDPKNRRSRGRRLINSIIMNLLKMLGVKCNGEGCKEDYFSNHIPARMSGIHMDHRGRKEMGPSDATSWYIDVLIAELKRGRCNPLCCFCHGVKTHG